MITILFAAALGQAVVPAPSPLGPIGQQSLPAKGCAAYLWNSADRQMVAMAVADPAMIRLSVDGRSIDLARSAQEGTVALGFGTTITYAGAGITARLAMTLVPRENLTAGAQVSDGSLQVDRTGRDTIVVPVAGLVGCVS